MANLNQLLINQVNLHRKIKTAFQYYEITYKYNHTIGSLYSRLSLLDSHYEKYIKAHPQILQSPNSKQGQIYFTAPTFQLDFVELLYADSRGQFLDEKLELLNEINGQPIPAVNNAPIQVVSRNDNQLPKITVPKFSGDYKESISFRDLFSEFVVKSNKPSSSKLSYLKETLSGEPLFLIKKLKCFKGRF